MEFFDAFVSLGRTNAALPHCPTTEAEALALMDRHDVAEGLVYHTSARDFEPEQGNLELEELSSPRLHKVWCMETAAIASTPVERYLETALRHGAKALMANPLMYGRGFGASRRLREMAGLLQRRRVPLLLAYRAVHLGEGLIDWRELATFCQDFPDLPVLAWEWRCRINRPLFDALAAASNLIVSQSCLWQHGMLAAITEAFGPGRLVFSMGLPHLDLGSFQATVNYALVDAAAKRAIAGGNMRKLLKEADYAL